MCYIKQVTKTKVDALIEALNANTAALKATIPQLDSVVPETEHPEPQPPSLE